MAKGLIIVSQKPETLFTLEELCEACDVPLEFVRDLLSYEIIEVRDANALEAVFDFKQLQRTRVAKRLNRDLKVNPAGIAIILDLLEELDELRAHAELLEKHFLK